MITTIDGRLKYYSNTKQRAIAFINSGYWKWDPTTPNGEPKFYTLRSNKDGASPLFMCRTYNWSAAFVSDNIDCDGHIRETDLGYVAQQQGEYGSNTRLYYLFYPQAGSQYIAISDYEKNAVLAAGFQWYRHIHWYAWIKN